MLMISECILCLALPFAESIRCRSFLFYDFSFLFLVQRQLSACVGSGEVYLTCHLSVGVPVVKIN